MGKAKENDSKDLREQWDRRKERMKRFSEREKTNHDRAIHGPSEAVTREENELEHFKFNYSNVGSSMNETHIESRIFTAF